MDVSDRYVDIKIDNPRRFLDVAALVDRPDFNKDMLLLRKKWKIVKTFQRKKGQIWQELSIFAEQVPKASDVIKKINEAEQSIQFMKDMATVKETPEKDLEHKEKVMREFRKKESWKRFLSLYFLTDVIKLRKKYRKPPNFDQIIISATVYGSVITTDYLTCEIGLNYIGEDIWQFHEPQPTIKFYPLVTTEEITNAYQKYGKRVLTEYQDKYLKGKVFDHDTASNVARDRKWYWWKQQGLSYGQIYKKAYEEGERLSIGAIIKAIKRYSKLLAIDI